VTALTSIYEVTREALSSGLDTAQKDDPERAALAVPAPNAIEWVVGKQWLNLSSTYKHTRQYQIIRDLFQLRCPICNPGGAIMSQEASEAHPGNCWGKSRMELEDEVLLRWAQDYEEDRCPKCGITRSEFEEDGLITAFDCLHLVCGMRSGKSVLAGLTTTYAEHRILTLALTEPGGIQGYLGMPTAEQLEMTLLASTDVQSQDTIWAKYRNYRELSPWFRRYVPWVKEQEKIQVTPPGMQPWSYSEGDKKIRNGLHKLLINSLNSNSGGLVGKTRLLSGADEIGRMRQTDSAQGANEIYRGLENSLRTVRSRAKDRKKAPWLGLMLSVTSPLAHEDKAMKLLRIGQSGRVGGMLAYHYATWDFNPFEPRENFDEEFMKDSVGAERDFGARPPMAAYPLVADPDRFLRNAAGAQQPTASFTYPTHVDATGQEYIGVELSHAQLIPVDRASRSAAQKTPYFCAFDAGKNFDAFAGACAHGEWREDSDGNTVLTTVFDWLIRIIPMGKGVEVHFDSVFELIKALSKKQMISRVEFDRWQSVQIIQQIRHIGVAAEQRPVKDADMRMFASDGLLGRIQMLPPEEDDDERDPPQKSPAGAAYYELFHLECDPKTAKVYNPRKGERKGWDSDDTSRVIAHCHKLVQMTGYTTKASDSSREARRARAEAGGADWAQRGQVFGGSSSSGGGSHTNSNKGRGW